MDPQMFFDGWSGPLRILIVGVAAYVALILMLRISGKRTLSKLNAFDFVVTVALGSTLASVITSDDLPLTQGVTALGLLVALQFVVTWSSVRWKALNRLVKSEPRLLLRAGEPLSQALRHERVTEDELLAAVRDRGGRDLSDAEAIVLESDGSLTALLKR
ncbi:MAG: DUF421 domain-containing protein [Phenylobacterium sp.]|uniref:DUF421 domain-containing protein n=1 Tax=Phenylobacterium sp. TaxID=1871053 RepID=UPI00391CE89C